MDVAEVMEISGHMRGIWGLTGTLRNLQSESNHIIFLNPLLHDSVQVILHFIWEMGLEGNWFDYCDFHSFAPFLTFFSSQCWQGMQVGCGKSLSFRIHILITITDKQSTTLNSSLLEFSVVV